MPERFRGDPFGTLMAEEDLPELVTSFVTSTLRHVDDFQLLVAMATSGDRWWDAESASRHLLIGKAEARAALERLAAQNLLEIRVTADVRYQLNPGTPQLRAAVRAALEAYRTDPNAVWRLVARHTGGRVVGDVTDVPRPRRDNDR